jgi:hypothetical protein
MKEPPEPLFGERLYEKEPTSLKLKQKQGDSITATTLEQRGSLLVAPRQNARKSQTRAEALILIATKLADNLK